MIRQPYLFLLAQANALMQQVNHPSVPGSVQECVTVWTQQSLAEVLHGIKERVFANFMVTLVLQIRMT